MEKEKKFPKREELEKKRIILGPGAWFDVIRAKTEGSSKEYVRINRYGQGWNHAFNFKNFEQWEAVKEAVENMLDKLGWEKEFASSIKEVDQIDKFKKLTKKQKGKINLLLKEMGVLRSQKLSSDIPKFETDLKQFSKKLKGKKKESKMQKWLERHTWFFGPKYLDQEPKKDWPGRSEFDFMLQRYDTFYDVIELKKPTDPLFVGSGKTPSKSRSPSAQLKGAISQMIDYLENIAIYGPSQYYKENIYTLKPEGIIVIGRTRTDAERKTLKVLNSYLHGIVVMSYDDLFKQAENFVKILKKRSKKKK